MQILRKMALCAAVAGVGLLSTAGAQASTLSPSLVSVVQVGSAYDWSYRVDLTTSSKIDTTGNSINQFVTIYDFAGYQGLVGTPVNSTPGSWAFTPSMTDKP